MGNTAAFTKAQAKSHDASLAAAAGDLSAALDRVHQCANEIHRSVGEREQGSGARWTMTLAQAQEVAGAVTAGGVEPAGALSGRKLAAAPGRAADALGEYDAAMLAVVGARAIVDELDEVWRTRGQWSRYFMVSGGDIHSSTSCHRLHGSTQIDWLPDLSGEAEAEVVVTYGRVQCSVCFPSAAAEWTITAAGPVWGELVGATRTAIARKYERPSTTSKDIA